MELTAAALHAGSNSSSSSKMPSHHRAARLLLLVLAHASALHTAPPREELSELARGLQAMVARVTVEAPGVWAPEYSLAANPEQADFSSVRYQLAFMGYGIAAAAAAATPAHTGTGGAILRDVIRRMLDPLVWGRAHAAIWSNATGSGFNPADPVAYQNVMYSGHLALSLVLYEGLTGDDTFATDGFAFAYNGSAPTHYTTDSLVRVLAEQSAAAPCGGIPCEVSRSPHSPCSQPCSPAPPLGLTLAALLPPPSRPSPALPGVHRLQPAQ